MTLSTDKWKRSSRTLTVRLYRKSFTLRNALQKRPPTTEVCRMNDCQLKSELCFIKNCVYKLSCNNCQDAYIGSTIRPFHARFREHLTRAVSSVFQHRSSCHGDFTPSIISKENDPVKLRFKEALLIQKYNPTINSRAEREELQHLIHVMTWTMWTRHSGIRRHIWMTSSSNIPTMTLLFSFFVILTPSSDEGAALRNIMNYF